MPRLKKSRFDDPPLFDEPTDLPCGEGQILCQSCEDLSELANESVHLTITSPPYWSVIDYQAYADNPEQWYRWNPAGEHSTYEEYLSWLDRVFGGVLEKTVAGGFCAVVIGTVLHEGRHLPLPFDFTARMTALGWLFYQDYIWNKVTGGINRARSFMRNNYPGYFYPNIMTEYILVFCKLGPKIYKHHTQSEKQQAQVPITRVFTKDVANNVWHIPPVPPNVSDHPCPFPAEIPDRLIRLYSYPGDLVLDPFCGTGQTLQSARWLGRNFMGYDTCEQYCQQARKKINLPCLLRSEQLVPEYAKVPVNEPIAGTYVGFYRGDDCTRKRKRMGAAPPKTLEHLVEVELRLSRQPVSPTELAQRLIHQCGKQMTDIEQFEKDVTNTLKKHPECVEETPGMFRIKPTEQDSETTPS